MRHTE
jgi:hypothetical protein